jgi:ribulose 1,5-bisphosphate synthetase/thiazole synthase
MSKKAKQGISRRQFLPAGMAAAALAAPQAASAHPPEVFRKVDVLVVGGGPAGIGAAVGAARAGADTLLIETHSFFGGVAAWGLGMQMNQMRPNGKARSAVHELLIGKVSAYGDQAVRFGEHELWCNVEYLKVAVLDTLDAAGVKYLLHVRAVDSIVERNRVAGVIIGTKRGLMSLRAKVVVDCTGDADVAYYAGAETMTDPKQLMPMTLALALANVDAAKTTVSEIQDAIRGSKAKYPLITSGFVEVKQIAHTKNYWVNHAGTSDLGRIDATDPEARTKAECFGRRQGLQMIEALRNSGNPALRQIEWAAGGPQMSVRESRRVKGLYIVTEEDAMSGRTFEDAIAWRSGFVDLGGQTGAKLNRMKIHDVPYRSILPEKVDGLLMGGRCISASHNGAAAGKSMGNCIATGHAAGVAAAMAAQARVQPRELKVPEIQARLRADGVSFDLHDRDQRGLKDPVL